MLLTQLFKRKIMFYPGADGQFAFSPNAGTGILPLFIPVCDDTGKPRLRCVAVTHVLNLYFR